MKRDLYAEVSQRIVSELERGAAPWVKPWSATPGQNVPQNAVTNRRYSGCNVVLLWLARNRGWTTPRFLTFKQAIEASGNVRKARTEPRSILSNSYKSKTVTAKKTKRVWSRCCASTPFSTSINARTYPIA